MEELNVDSIRALLNDERRRFSGGFPPFCVGFFCFLKIICLYKNSNWTQRNVLDVVRATAERSFFESLIFERSKKVRFFASFGGDAHRKGKL